MPTESIGFNYAKLTTEFIPQNPDGSSGTPITFCWDNIGNMECTATNSVPPAPPGSFNDPSNGGTVTPCPAGTFTDTAGQSACTPAPAGSFATGPGATSATLCPAGTFSSTPGSASCTPAPPGSYVPTTGATSTTLCPAGTYCPNPGTVTPLTCPVHYFCGVGTVTPLPEIESITPTTGGSQVTFNTGAGGFTNLNAINPTSLPTPPPPGSYPFGLFSFSIIGFAPATSDTITITYPNPITPGTQYLKFVGGTWIAAPFTSSGNTITITIIDNGVLDSNPAIGTISDPGGILATTPGKVTGGGSIGKNTEFGLDANTGDDSKKIQGDIEYQNKTAHVNFHGHKIQLLSIDSTQTQATIIGTGTFDIKDHEDEKKKAPPAQFTFLVTVVDPDKKGIHDQLTITIFDATNKVVYHDAGTVKGHIEIHKSTEHNGHENDKGKSEK